ncbi:MAG TPA: Holliday junction branch migration DNA helicase RuvB [Anaerolineae bacterium]|nr:Holliday junction branch migration DNA helicase RuvB [Anaerolineae bacterium]
MNDQQQPDLTLHRPQTLDAVIGQAAVKANLRILIEAAQRRSEPLPHLLFYGPPGTGKTTLAQVCARAMNAPLKIISAPTLEKAGDLAAILTNLAGGDVLFVDEIHRLAVTIAEVLYPALEDFALDIIIGSGPGARTVRLPLPRFTLIGATTRLALLPQPLQDRFGVLFQLELYSEAELTTIIANAATQLDIAYDLEGLAEIARCSRGTPRLALRYFQRARDYAEVQADGVLTRDTAGAALDLLGIDANGLTKQDRQMLTTLIQTFAGRPVGLSTLAAALDEAEDTLETTVEPYLLRCGLLERTPRGRVATPAARAWLGCGG